MQAIVKIRNAEKSEAALLTEVALCSKAYWGYTDKFMEACRRELLVTEEKIQSSTYNYFVAEEQKKIIGYYAIEKLSSKEFELEALFVRPNRIGSGIGKKLINHAKNFVLSNGGYFLLIQGDPNAVGFYEKVGGKSVGTRESASIPGRFLPLFKISLMDEDVVA